MTKVGWCDIDYIDFNLSAMTTSSAVPRKNRPGGSTAVVRSIVSATERKLTQNLN